MDLIRTQTEQEKSDFIDISGKDRNTAKAKFEEELSKKQLEAIKKGLPFAEKACRDEFNDYWENAVKDNIRKNGFLNASEIKPVRIDFKKFSDISNFEEISNGETHDEHLSKRNPGVNVTIAWTKYKFKGYANEYVVMEDPADAVKRALKAGEEAKARAK
jgi:hypothetical protein